MKSKLNQRSETRHGGCQGVPLTRKSRTAKPVHPARAGMPALLLWGLLAVATSQALAVTHVVSITPSQNALNQPAAASVVVQFDNPIDPTTVTASSFLVAGQNSGPHSGSFAFALGDKQITFTPGAAFARGETVLVNLSTQLKDAAHNAITSWASQFNIATVPNAAKFAQGVRYPVGDHPTSLVAYDLRHNGKLDLVVASGGYGGASGFTGVSVLLGNGDGTFQPRTDYPTATGNKQGAVSVVVADVNHDGHGDAIVANYGDNSVAVLLGDGLGGFGPPVTYHLADYPWTVRVADLDGDGFMDIVVCNEGFSGGNGVQILWGNANGTFTVTVPINSNTSGHFGLALGDVNGDGLTDIITTDWQGNVWVLVNQGGRTFAPGVSYSTGGLPRGVALADFNGDGKLDFVAACQGYYGSPPPNYTGVTTVQLGNGDGTFAQRVDYPVNGLTVNVAAGDFNGDGRPDFATANLFRGNPYPAQSVSAWKNSGAGAFAIREDLNTGGDNPWAIVAADFNGDGRLDLATVNWHQYTGGGDVSVLMNVSANVSGSAYVDVDRNCAQNGPDEVGVGGQLVSLTDNTGVSRYEVSQTDGTFNSVLPAGSYTVKMVHSATSEETCNGGLGVTYNITVAEGAPVTGLVFGVGPKCAASVTCASWPGWPCPPNPPSPPCTHGTANHIRKLCPCEQFEYAVTLKNTGNQNLLAGSVIQLQLDPNLKFIGFPSIPSSCPILSFTALGGVTDPNPPCNPASGGPNTGQLLEWTLGSDLLPYHFCLFYANVQVANVALGTFVCASPLLKAFTAHCPGSMLPTVTSQGNCDEVSCSFDPNDKTVSPTGCGPFGNVAPGTPLTYRVEFQNLGNASASKVIVRDVLDPALDPATLQILSTKQTLTGFQILPGQEMIWTFDNINLPAAVSDEMGSRGEFVYSVLPKSSAGEGTTIFNTAAIYFDQNPPVNTAITTNTIHSQPVPNAAFTAQHSPTDAGLLYNFTYTGNTPDGAVFAWDFGPGATPPTSTDRNPVGIRFATAGPKTVTLTLNRYGCAASATATIQARVIPLLTCPGYLSLSTTSSAGSVVTFDVTASGGCDTNIVVQCSPPSGSLFPVGLTLVTCTAVDGCGASNQCSFVVEVVLLQIHLSCPPTIQTEAASPAGTNVSFQVSAFSDCSPTNVVLNCSPASGSLFPMGQTTVNCTAWAACGLTNTCSFVVEVVPQGQLKVALKITPADSSFVLSWPDPSTGFRLQSADTLVPPNWTDVALPVVVTNGEKTVALPLPLGPIEFYRLIKP